MDEIEESSNGEANPCEGTEVKKYAKMKLPSPILRSNFSFPKFRRNTSYTRKHSIAFTSYEISDTKGSTKSSLLILYAIFQGICGFVLPISDAFSRNDYGELSEKTEHKYYYESFLMIQYILAILVLAYLQGFIIYFTWIEQKSSQKEELKERPESLSKFYLDPDNTRDSQVNLEENVKTNSRNFNGVVEEKAFHQTGKGVNLYLRLGAVGFGFGVMVLDGFKIADKFENHDVNLKCHSSLWIPKNTIHLIYVFWQTYFIFKYHKISFGRQNFFIRFILSHMAVTNLCQWFKTVIEEIVEHNKNHNHQEMEKNHSLHSNTTYVQECHSVVNNLKPYLIPCAVEYSLISGAVFFKIFQRVGHKDKHPKNQRIIPNNTEFQFSECHKSHRGLFVGLLLLIVTLVAISLFFVIDNTGSKSPQRKSILLYQGTELTLLCISLVTCFAVLFQMRRLKFNPLTEEVAFDDNLLLIGMIGILFYDLFLLIPALEVASISNYSAQMFAIKAVMEMIQSMTQVFLILEASRRCAKNAEHIINKPGRTLVVLLLIINLAMWIVNIFEVRQASMNIIHSHYYTNIVWGIITHTLLPLIIFFRFHSTVCLSDIWTNAYNFDENS